MIVLQLKRAIGKMGNLAKSGVTKAGQAVKQGYSEAKTNYPEVKSRVGKAAQKANRAANRGMDYAVRVRNNADKSPLFDKATVEGYSFNKTEIRRPQRKRSNKTTIIYVNNYGRKKKRKSQNKRSGFSLI